MNDDVGAQKCQQLHSDFAAAEPFPHLAVSDLCDDGFLRSVRAQIISELKADYKETDIFKVLQTGDLANLKDSDSSLQSVLKLRDTIYSTEFRSFVQQVTGCPPLTDQVDCSCNIYPEGGHLLCHDDVIGSRCVSYIVYLTDPDLEWKASDGGALELYAAGPDEEPECIPVKCILPEWNQMVFFCVEPDVSFHSVQEVRTSENHRLSISGWFHTASEHCKISRSSLNQLQTGRETSLSTFSFEPEEHGIESVQQKATQWCIGDELEESDVAYLMQFVNSIYLNQENIEQVYKTFQEEGSIQLRDFLNKELVDRIHSGIIQGDGQIKEGHEIDGWSVKGPPHKQRYLHYNGGCSDDTEMPKIGKLLQQIEKDVFQSCAFQRLLHQLTGTNSLSGSSEMRCFRPGSDYTIAVYKPTKQETLDAVLCFLSCPDEETQTQWDFGEVGGFEAYLLADTKEEAAADVYRVNDEDSGVLSVSPANNTLNLVLADEGLIKFVKYVSAAAPGCRWDISAEYCIEPATESAGSTQE